jgi:uncharacterized protein (DUF2147 family)
MLRQLLRKLCKVFASLLLLGLVGGATATQLDGQAAPQAMTIEGDWLVQSRDAVIRIERQGDHYEGRIVWQLHDAYGPEDGAELDGKVVTDRNNPDPSLRAQPLTGLRMLWGLRYDPGRSLWVDGRVYNSENGKTYQCQVRLRDNDHLILRGYIGISMLGGSTTWTRTKFPEQTPGSSGVTR